MSSVFMIQYVKVKVKVSLEQATKAQRGNRCIALFFLNLLKPSGFFTYHKV